MFQIEVFFLFVSLSRSMSVSFSCALTLLYYTPQLSESKRSERERRQAKKQPSETSFVREPCTHYCRFDGNDKHNYSSRNWSVLSGGSDSRATEMHQQSTMPMSEHTYFHWFHNRLFLSLSFYFNHFVRCLRSLTHSMCSALETLCIGLVNN